MRRASTSRSSSNFNPRPSYEERPEQELCEMMDAISIHAPHTRSDKTIVSILIISQGISIHAPHTRSDLAKEWGHAPHTRSDLHCRS